MQQLWQALSKGLSQILAASLLAGCATYQPSVQVSPDFIPRDTKPTLPEVAQALERGTVELVGAADGSQIPVRVFGTAGSKRPVLMTHGLESHSGWFVQSAAFIAGLGHPVYLVDRRGSGLSRQRRGHCDDFQEWSRDLENVARHALNRHHTDKLHIIGHCFGAIPATVFAIEHSNDVASLVLPTPGFVTATDLTLSQKCRVLGDRLGGKASYLPVPLAPEQFTNAEDYRQFIRDDELKLHEVTTAFYWNVNRARKFVRAHREEVRCPIWMGLAGQDEIIRREPTRELFREFGSDQKRLVIFPEAKHILEFGPARDAFFRELEKWLNGCGE